MVSLAIFKIEFALIKIYDFWFVAFKEFIIFKYYYKKTKKG